MAPWEAPVAVVENHKEASCPVMDGETNGLWSCDICETKSAGEASALKRSQTARPRQGTANAGHCAH